MPTTLKVLLHTTAICVILFGFMSYQKQPAAQQATAERQQSEAQREHDGVGAESGGASWRRERRSKLAQIAEQPPTRHVRVTFGLITPMIQCGLMLVKC